MIEICVCDVLMGEGERAEREFFLSECASWLILHIGERSSKWWFDRNANSGRVEYITILDPIDATAFKLKFGI
jgi:hypothetical protein